MRTLFLITWLALAGGCSRFAVRCDTHLRPINPRQPALSHQPLPAGTREGPKASSSVAGEPVKP